MSEAFDPNEWITSREAAELTGYTSRNLTRAANAGSLRPIKRGNMLFFQKSEILRYMQEMSSLGRKKHTTKKHKKKAD